MPEECRPTDLRCVRCRVAVYPAEGSWQERNRWYSYGDGFLCPGCVTEGDWDDAVANAPEIEVPTASVVAWLAEKLAEEDDEKTAGVALAMLRDIHERDPGAASTTLDAISAIRPGGAVALRRIVEAGIRERGES
jgi:hypothetical protein